jgi:CubicO group peptidase (beta-lactamase class C family)
VLEKALMPLTFEPGTSFAYGMGLELVGVIIVRLNHMATLEEYMQKHVWDPLGITKITFHTELKPEVKENLVTMSVRKGIKTPYYNRPKDTGETVEWAHDLLYDDPTPMGDECGGHGAIGSAAEYIKILNSICANDGTLLKPSTVDYMFTPQLAPGPRAAFQTFTSTMTPDGIFDSLPRGTNVDFGLGGRLILDDLKTGVRKGTISWSGMPNLLWRIDREAGLSLLYASNILPYGDYNSHRFQQLFEKEMYARLAKVSKL